ncbi:MAG: hypothetical protein AB7O88_05170 [Reyranellaceae bacterium]
MSPPSAPKRPLAPCTVVALEVIAAAESRRMHLADFELSMHQRGCGSREVARALGSLARRGWASVVGSSLSITDAGEQAAARGGAPASSARRRRRRRERMPPGLL